MWYISPDCIRSQGWIWKQKSTRIPEIYLKLRVFISHNPTPFISQHKTRPHRGGGVDGMQSIASKTKESSRWSSNLPRKFILCPLLKANKPNQTTCRVVINLCFFTNISIYIYTYIHTCIYMMFDGLSSVIARYRLRWMNVERTIPLRLIFRLPFLQETMNSTIVHFNTETWRTKHVYKLNWISSAN